MPGAPARGSLGRQAVGHEVPEPVLELNGRTWALDPSTTYTIGRDPQGHVVVEDPRVSWRHANLRWVEGSWFVEDRGSTNGTFLRGRRVERAEVVPGTELRLGNAVDGPRLDLLPAHAPAHGGPTHPAPATARPVLAAPEHAPRAEPHLPYVPDQSARPAPRPAPPPADDEPHHPDGLHRLAAGFVTRIGRGPENDLVVHDLQVSRRHAEFRSTRDGHFEIVDLGSHHGTYVNGRPVQRQVLGPHDLIGVGRSTFCLVGDQLEEFVDTGEVPFSVRRLAIAHEGRQILGDLSFTVPERSLVAVIGPPGSGKSALLDALTGRRPADRGEVLYNHRNLYRNFPELRRRIGLVPRDCSQHEELTVRTALTYAAKLRFPGDTKAAERAARVDEVLYELGLDADAHKKTGSLSDGRRKRVSLALELLTDPSLLFLDEPTPGLDPSTDRDVMELLRDIADEGRTVLLVTGSVADLALCDHVLVMAPGGSLAYFGPPEEALSFFGYNCWTDVFAAFETYRDYDWAARWRGSQHYQRYAAELDTVAPQPVRALPGPGRAPRPQRWPAQLLTLVRRCFRVLFPGRRFLLLMVLLPAVFGAVSALIPADGFVAPQPPARYNGGAGLALMIMVVGASLSGAAGSVRQLAKERAVYERERAVGLSRSAYLMSKVFVLGLITALQTAVICAVALSVRELPERGLVIAGAPAVELFLPVLGVGFVSMMLGLVVSALVRTERRTMPLAVVYALVQLAFTGVLFRLFGNPGLEQLAWLMPARWAVGAAAATLDLSHLMAPWDAERPRDLDPLWDHTVAQWTFDLAVLLVIALACCFAVARLLRRRDREALLD
ncbi:FHA domain-containing protein [Streptomyces pathocidini]